MHNMLPIMICSDSPRHHLLCFAILLIMLELCYVSSTAWVDQYMLPAVASNLEAKNETYINDMNFTQGLFW